MLLQFASNCKNWKSVIVAMRLGGQPEIISINVQWFVLLLLTELRAQFNQNALAVQLGEEQDIQCGFVLFQSSRQTQQRLHTSRHHTSHAKMTVGVGGRKLERLQN